MLKGYNSVGGPYRCLRKRWGVPAVQAVPLPLRLAAAPPTAALPLPLSYRASTTSPTFRPETASCQQYAPGPPQLLSRHITLNPLHSVSAWLEAQAYRVDLLFATSMDRWPLLHAPAAVATAALTYWGLHPLMLLSRGLPAPLADWLAVQLGDWAVGLAVAAALAVGLAAALWQLRNWTAVQLALVGMDEALRGAVDAWAGTATVSTSTEASGEAATAGARPAEAPFSMSFPEVLRGLFRADWKDTDRTWLYVVIATRLGTLLLASRSLLAGATTTAAAYAGLCFAASLLPLAVPHVRQLLTATTARAGAGGAARLAVPLLLADAAFLLALSPALSAVLRIGTAAVLALGLGLAAVAAAATPRLERLRAAAGDVATFHVTVRLPLSGTLIDTTIGHMPLRAIVGPDAGGDDDSSTTATASTTDSGSCSANPPGKREGTVVSLSAPQPQSAETYSSNGVCDPQARFRPLLGMLAAAALEGMFVGERRSLTVSSTDGGPPFQNPGLVWWQSLDDLQRKIGSNNGSRPLQTGDVFWYPVGGLVSELGSTRLSTAVSAAEGPGGGAAVAALPGVDSWGPVEVAAVAGDWVQLDANVGLMGGRAEVEVQLVALDKGR